MTSADAEFLEGLLAIIGGALIIVLCVTMVMLVINIVSCWKIYEKAGENGWAAIIPFYSNYVLAKITWGNGWIFVLPFALSFITYVFEVAWLAAIGTLISLAFTVITNWKLARAFGHGVPFTIGLVFLSIVFLPILAFGDSQYFGVPQGALCLSRKPNSGNYAE